MKLNYTLKDLQTLQVEEGSKIPIFTELLMDGETPISLYKKLKSGNKYSFLLESAQQAEKLGRYSFLGFGNYKHITFKDGLAQISKKSKTERRKTQDPLKLMQEELLVEKFVADPLLPRFQGGWVGYITYDCVKYFDQIKLPQKRLLNTPEMEFVLPENVLIHDNQRRRLYIVSYLEFKKSGLQKNFDETKRQIAKITKLLVKGTSLELFNPINTQPLKHNKNPRDYEKKVKSALEKVKKGEIFQVVLSQSFTKTTDESSLNIYRKMRDLNPSPYMYLLDFKDLSLIGSSPETLVQVENKKILVRPIAGTRKRGSSLKEDKALAKDLLNDSKERAEHQMLVDLARNDVGKVAKKGKVSIKNYMKIQKYSHVMHIVSDVTGTLDASKTIFDTFKSCFPAGTLSGAPKIRAMQSISELENIRRGIYGGAVGYFDFSGNMDFAIAIRTIVKKGKKAYAQAGAGIVFDSIPKKEFEECINKVSSSLSSI